MGDVLSIDHVRLQGQTILYRVDVNSPLDPSTGKLLDDGRLRAILPSLREMDRSKVVIMAHQSRPGKSDYTSTEEHSMKLQDLLGKRIDFVPDVCGKLAIDAIGSMTDGEVIFLDNVRGVKEEYGGKRYNSNEETEDTKIASVLSAVADIYVSDAFAAAHRRSPTLTGFTGKIPCVAGRLMQKEIEGLRVAIRDPPDPYLVILGGAKCDDSLRVAINLIARGKLERIAFVGVVGNLMLWASGVDIGGRNAEFIRETLGEHFDETWEQAESLITNHSDLLFLPRDVAVEKDGARFPLSLEDLPTNNPIYDVGIQTLMDLKPLVHSAGCILWNGPASYFELPDFAFGTIEILNMCVESPGMAIIGGGHTSALVNQRGVANEVYHNSTGGGSTISFLSGQSMPVIASLKDSRKKFEGVLEELGLSP